MFLVDTKHADLLGELKEKLSSNANGMYVPAALKRDEFHAYVVRFRWVQVWLQILIPIYDDQNTIRDPNDAKRKLEALQSDVTHIHEAYQRLEAGYQRLWDLNSMSGFEDRRICLFSLVLAAYEPFTPDTLRDALRIQCNSYNEHLTTENIKRLYANFLHTHSGSHLRFVHDSARKFILNMKMNQASRVEQSDATQFTERMNHLCFARLYIETMEHSDHPCWKHVQLDPSIWSEYGCDPVKQERLDRNIKEWPDMVQLSDYKMNDETSRLAIYAYLTRWGLRHCSQAAEKRSLSDKLWTEVLHRVVLSPTSAFGFVTCVQKWVWAPNHKEKELGVDVYCALCEQDGRLKLLYSHVLALLDIIHQDDLPGPSHGDSELREKLKDSRLQKLFQDATCMGGWKETSPLLRKLWLVGENRGASNVMMKSHTALQLACIVCNQSAVKMFLQCTRILHGYAESRVLLETVGDWTSPLSKAFRSNEYDTVEALLNFEERYGTTISIGRSRDSERSFSVTEQRPIIYRLSGRTALSFAVLLLEEEQVSSSLKSSHHVI